MTVGFKDFHNPLDGRASVHLFGGLVTGLDEGRVSLDPEYQRGVVWDQAHQEEFMGFWLEGGSPPTIFYRELPFGHDFEYEVVDGKQRCTSALRWWRGEIGARLSDGRLVWKRDFDATELRFVKTRLSVPVTILTGTDKDILSAYLKLNNRGVGHTVQELDRVRALRDSMGA